MIVVLKVSIETGMLPVPLITIVVNVKSVINGVQLVMVHLILVTVSLVLLDITYVFHSKLLNLVVQFVQMDISPSMENACHVPTHVILVPVLNLINVLVVKLHTP